MRQEFVIFACLCSALVYALPLSDSSKDEGLQLVQIPLGDNKELDILSVDENGRLSERSKRTIGILRELFPELTKQVEGQINVLIGQVIRTLGPTILRTAIQGGGATRARDDFDADFDDDDDDDDDTGGRVQLDLPSFDPSEDEDLKDTTNLNSGDNSIDLNALNEQLQETIRVARQAASENSVTSDASSDQDGAESKSPAIDELTLDAEDIDGDDRNKRFLNFGFGGSAQGGGVSAGAQASLGGGSGAGSGNFLFDIIRRTADRAARAAGTVYRVVAGTETLDLNDTGSQKFSTTTKTQQPGQISKLIDRTSRTINDGLFTGSVQTPQGDERANAPASGDDSSQANAAGDGYTEGIPGPVTRLVVLANRGLANLIQDLILRIAATSERLVNFKARLITSLI